MLVNGVRPPASGAMIDPADDVVTVSGEVVRPPRSHRYVLLNKPLGVITTARDEAGRLTVLDSLGAEGTQGRRLFPVGRLDADSTGLLILTDDGDLAFRLTHPRYKVAKEYRVVVAGVPAAGDIQALREGVRLDDGVTAPAQVEIVDGATGAGDSRRAVLRVSIREGRHRQVRRMLQAVGHRVQALERTSFGPVRLGRLKPGGWRVLGVPEVAALRRAAGLEQK